MKTVREKWLVIVSVLLMVLMSLGVVACKPKTYTLTFETNGGGEIAPITAEAGAEIDPPADPGKEGFTFDGWYTSADFSGEQAEIPTVMPEQNITYYAKYTEIPRATLTLDAGVGTLETSSYSLEVGANVSEFVKDILPVTSGSLIFDGWYNGSSKLGANVTLPAAGLTLTARYKATYTVEIYLQNAPGSEEYVLDEDSETEGGTDYLGETIDLSSALRAPTGYRLNRTKTQAITLSAEGENVYKAYFDFGSYTVYYFDNAPEGATVEGSMENGSVYYNYETQIPATGYSIEGYRFAGWATSPRGDVVYQSGDMITASGTLMLYACWNRALADSNGGKDILYVLKEKPGTVALVRELSAEREGVYDAGTRTFYFGKDANDNSLPRGRVSADGATFAYYYEDFALSYSRYEWMGGEVLTEETLVLDGVDGARYTYTENGAEKTVEGTYAAESGNYRFVSEDGSVNFVFMLTETTEETPREVFLVQDSFAGSYYYMNSSGSIAYFPLLIVDGYGNVLYVQNLTTGGMLTGTYEPSSWENVIELTFETTSGTQTTSVRLTKDIETTSGTTMDVFEEADGLQGRYTFRTDSESGRAGGMTADVGGFGTLNYSFVPDDGSSTVTGSVSYSYPGTYTQEDVVYGLFWFTVGTGDSAHRYTVRFEAGKTEASLVGNEGGVYSEISTKSPYTARLYVHGDGTAAVYFLMQSQTYSPLIEGTYVAAGSADTYVFTAASYAEGNEESLSPYYGSFTFRIYPSGWQFAISDGSEGTYAFVMSDEENGDTNWTLTCNGFGYATLQPADGTGTATEAPYALLDGYGEYKFIRVSLSTIFGTFYYYFRVTEGSSAADLYTGALMGTYVDFGNRISEYTEQLVLYPDGHAIVRVLSGEEYVTAAEGSYRQEEGTSFFTFTAASAPAEQYACYASFTFNAGTLSNTYVFCYYDASEAMDLTFRGQTISVTGYGILTIGENQTQYMYQFIGEEDGYTYLYIRNFSGSLIYRIRYDAASQALVDAGEEMGSYYSCLYNEANENYVVGEYVLTLDGYGAATLIHLNSETSSYEEFAAGTYTVGADQSYSIVWTSGEVSWNLVAMSTRTVNGNVMPVYIISDPSLEMTYEIVGSDGVVGEISVDSFGRVTYTDSEGTFRAAYQVVKNETTGQTLLQAVVYDEEGTATASHIYVVTDENPDDKLAQLRETDGKVGTYVLVENGMIYAARTMVFDGFGNAVWINDDGEKISGTYAAAEGSNEWTFTSDSASFTFMTTTVSSADGVSYSAYIVYGAKWDAQFSSSDWQVIAADGYVSATLVDFYGKVYTANYSVLGESGTILHLYSSALGDRYFKVDAETGTFVEITDEFIAENGVLLAYQGAGGDVKIPEGITEIANSVFYGVSLKSVDLSGVRVIGDYAFQATLVESVTGGENVTAIGAGAFFDCIRLKAVSFPAAVSVGRIAFRYCTALENVSFGAALTSVGDSAFADCATYNNGALLVTLGGTTAPDMGADVFADSGKKGVSVAVKDIATAVAFRTAWADTYASFVGVSLSPAASALAGNYYTDLDVFPQMAVTLGVRVLLNGEAVGAYDVSGATLVVYLFDASAQGYSVVNGALAADHATVTLNEVEYTFYPEGTTRTFRDADNNELVIPFGYGSVTGTYKGTETQIFLGEEFYFLLDGYRHTLTLNFEAMTFTETVEFEEIVRNYVAYGEDDYNSNLSVVEGRDAEGNVTWSIDHSARNRLYKIDKRAYNVSISDRNSWTIEFVSEDAEAKTITYRLAAPVTGNYAITYYVLIVVDHSEANEDGTYTFTYSLEKAAHPSVVVAGLEESGNVGVTVFYEKAENGSGAISGFALTIGETVVESRELSLEGSVYTFSVAEGEYAGTYTVSVSGSSYTKIASVTFVAAASAAA